MHQEPIRQVHLDFHTSEHIPGIGSAFSKRDFQSKLREGRIGQINIFAKCHHSWSYYPTKIGRPHPNLAIDLLGSQIEACHEIGVKAPVYYTGGWSAADAEAHPEWCMRTATGQLVAPGWDDSTASEEAKPPYQWKELCVGTAYHSLMLAQVKEICNFYEVDGFFFDIYRAHLACYCETCRARAKSAGRDLRDQGQALEVRARTIADHAAQLFDAIREMHPRASVFFNGTTTIEEPVNRLYGLYGVNTKQDLEDLPTTWGGYDILPIRARYFHKLGKPVVAMSGKFHKAWGEFGGFKDPEALRFEAAAMIAQGARCNFGDHLHPSGAMDETTYRNIGHAFEYVERIEEYGIGGTPAASVGLVFTEDPEANEGAARMLMEEQIDFDLVTSAADWEQFRTVVVPSQRGCLTGWSDAVHRHLHAGGAILTLGAGALLAKATGEAGGIAWTSEVESLGHGDSDVDYTLISAPLTSGTMPSDGTRLFRRDSLPSTPFLNYHCGEAFSVPDGAVVLATVEEPYFSRTYGRYCGHLNTPNNPGVVARPAAIRVGNQILASHPLDRLYYSHGAKVHRSFFARMLRLILRRPMLEALLPSAGRLNLLHQPDKRRYVAHLLYGPPIRRGDCLVVEDLPRLLRVPVSLRVPASVSRVHLIPDRIELDFLRVTEPDGEVIETEVPAFVGHCAVVAEY